MTILANHSTRRVALASTVLVLLLVLLQWAWEGVWAPTGRGTLVLKALPWLLALPGLYRGRLYTYRWVSLLVWLYVMEASVRVYSDGGISAWCAAGQLFLCLGIFALCLWRVRMHQATQNPTMKNQN